MTHPPTRDTLDVEDAAVVSHEAFPGQQHVLRLRSPAIAAAARPGNFVHVQCDPALPMRRPMSIMRSHGGRGEIEILYKVHGTGTRLLAGRRTGESISLIGPIGVPFRMQDYRAHPLLIGGGVGIPPMIFLAEHMRRSRPRPQPLVLMGSEVPFPFASRPSTIMVDNLPPDCIAAMPLLEDWGIASRLASASDFPGCFPGLVTDLARRRLAGMDQGKRDQVEIFSCGPMPMLRAVAALAREFELPCQVSLEEYMACAVGGCAGCAVRVVTPTGVAMRRVCVDGPVFEAATVFPAGSAG